MRWRLGLLVVSVLVGVLVVGGLTTRGGADAPAQPATAPEMLDSLPAAVTISVPQNATGRTVPHGFLGLSFEFQAVRAYTGSDPRHINPVLKQLIRNLTPGQAPVLRIGGDSTDASYVPAAGVRPPPYVAYPLTPSWLATTGALARQTGARMIMGLNLAANEPALAAAEGRAFVKSFGRTAIAALEIGNEPNIYNSLTIYHTILGLPVHVRPRTFAYPAFRREFEAIARAAPHLTLAGPALAAGPTPGRGSWVQTMPDFLARDPRVQIMTIHRYPLRNCYVPPSSPQYPTVDHLLSPYATVDLAAGVRRWLAIAHHQHRRLRIDELNSVACRGKSGISDTFASSLWVTDALFSLLNAGADGVNLHTLPGSFYQLFAFSHDSGGWRASVRPVYYGLQLFAQAAPPGSRLLTIGGLHGSSSVLSVWATRSRDRIDRVVLIDKDRNRSETVTVRPPHGTPGGATLERMRAPDVRSASDITLGGQTYGQSTDTGQLAPSITEPVSPGRHGGYRVTVPKGSAALLTLRPSP
jgi:hypothetical protein